MKLRDNKGRFVSKLAYGGSSATNTGISQGYNWNNIMGNSQVVQDWISSYDLNNYNEFNNLQKSWLQNYNNSNFKSGSGLLNRDPNVATRQQRYNNINNGALNGVIEQAITDGRITRAGLTGDNAQHGYVDGFFGNMENLRHGGSSIGNAFFTQDVINNINSKLNPKGLNYELGEDGMYYIKPYILTPAANDTSADPSRATTVNQSSFLEFLEEQKARDEVLNKKPINKTAIANSLEALRLGMGLYTNNKVANRAIAAEKPLLLDPIEQHRNIYGDLRSKMQGEEGAARLQNLASKPMTSDSNLQLAAQLEAKQKGELFILQGNQADDQMLRQTSEVSWAQEKENALVRHQVAMQNREALLQTQKNISNLRNVRDSVNFSLTIAPFLGAWEQRLRNKEVEQEAYEKQYQLALADQEAWNTPVTDNADKEALRRRYLTQKQTLINYLSTPPTDTASAEYKQWEKDYNLFTELMQDMKMRSIQKQAAIHDVYLNSNLFNQNTSLSNAGPWTVGYGGYSGWSPTPLRKDGGTIYKAKLSKRAKDNDRGAKSIEETKKLAAKFLEQSIDLLYTYPNKRKNKKRKYQAGGGLPLTGFTPIFATSEGGAPTTTEKASKSADLTSKEFLALLKDMDALPADINVIVSLLKNFEIAEQLDVLGLGSTSGIASKYMQILAQIKNAKFLKEEYKNAYDTIKSNGSLNELAINSEGYFIGMNTDRDYQLFSPNQVINGEAESQGYKLLTNSNLLYLRANGVPFDHLLLNMVQSGTSMEVITKQINDIISNLGKTRQSAEGYSETREGQIIKGIEYLTEAVLKTSSNVAEGLTIDGLYKNGYLTENQAQQAQLAIGYILNALPTNAKALLQVKGGGAEGAMQIVLSLVYSKLDSTVEFKTTKEKEKEGSIGKIDKNTGLIDKMNMDPVSMLRAGYGLKSNIIIQTSTSGLNGLQVPTISMAIVKKDGNPIGAGTLDDVAESAFAGYLDFLNASMGGVMIDDMGRDKVAVDGTALHVGYLPVDMEEYYMTGNIKPDIDMLERYNNALKKIKANNITDPEQINQIYQEYQLPIMFDENGDVLMSYKKFGIINGTAISTAFNENVDFADYITEVTDENQIQNTISKLQKGRGEKDRIDFDGKSWLDSIFGTDYDRIYAGTIFIPVNEDYFAGNSATGNYPKVGEASQIEALQQAKEKQNTYINPGQLE